MIYKKQKKVALSDIEKDQQTIKRLVAQSLAKKFPLYEAGRNTVGFLNGMVSQELTDRITDLFRGHSREMQNEIAADADGVVKSFNVAAGQSVKAHESLVILG